MTDPAGAQLVDAARRLAESAAAGAAATEGERRLPVAFAREIARAGLLRMLVPRSLGGLELDPATMIEVIATLARGDGAAGWCAMIGATTAVISAYLPPATAGEIYARQDVITGGAFHPRGFAAVESEGFRVSGRWPFASGCESCDWLLGGSVLVENGRPRTRSDGSPEWRLMIFPASEVEIVDTWRVSGLRGTGSHDIAVENRFVPRDRSVSLTHERPRVDAPLYAFPVFGLLALGIAAVAVGIAERAIEELCAMAHDKVPTGSRRSAALRAAVQGDVARATGLVAAARAHLLASIDRAWRSAAAGQPIALEERARLRLAATQATRSAASAVDLMYEAGGGSSIYERNPLQRAFRDVHAVTQHVMVAPATLELVGRVLLGIPTETEML